MKCARAVVLRNKVSDYSWQADLFCQFCAVRYVTCNDLRALLWPQPIVWIISLLVINEVLRRG